VVGLIGLSGGCIRIMDSVSGEVYKTESGVLLSVMNQDEVYRVSSMRVQAERQLVGSMFTCLASRARCCF
jgi:hypothetical protein